MGSFPLPGSQSVAEVGSCTSTGLPGELAQRLPGAVDGPFWATSFASAHQSFHLNSLLLVAGSAPANPHCPAESVASEGSILSETTEPSVACLEPVATSTMSWMGGEQRGRVSYLMGGRHVERNRKSVALGSPF